MKSSHCNLKYIIRTSPVNYTSKKPHKKPEEGADEVIADGRRKVALMHSKVKTALATLAANTTGRTFMPEEVFFYT